MKQILDNSLQGQHPKSCHCVSANLHNEKPESSKDKLGSEHFVQMERSVQPNRKLSYSELFIQPIFIECFYLCAKYCARQVLGTHSSSDSQETHILSQVSKCGQGTPRSIRSFQAMFKVKVILLIMHTKIWHLLISHLFWHFHL